MNRSVRAIDKGAVKVVRVEMNHAKPHVDVGIAYDDPKKFLMVEGVWFICLTRRAAVALANALVKASE